MGDITHIYAKDETGTPILKAEYAYDAWGKVTILFNDADNIANINPFRYRGYYYDLETGLYYLQTRYYDPETGRFINADAIAILSATKDVVNGLNLFAYCFNNPVNATDHDGDMPNWLKWVIGAAFIVVGIAVSIATAGAGISFMAALGSALLTTSIQVGIGMAVSVGVAGIVNVASGGGFFDNIGDTLASAFMWGGIFTGGAQILSGGFKIASNIMTAKNLTTGAKSGIQLGKTEIKILSPNSLKHFEVGGTLIKFGKYARLDVGTQYGLHLHTILNSAKTLPALIKHFPIGAIIGGIIGGTR